MSKFTDRIWAVGYVNGEVDAWSEKQPAPAYCYIKEDEAINAIKELEARCEEKEVRLLQIKQQLASAEKVIEAITDFRNQMRVQALEHKLLPAEYDTMIELARKHKENK